MDERLQAKPTRSWPMAEEEIARCRAELRKRGGLDGEGRERRITGMTVSPIGDRLRFVTDDERSARDARGADGKIYTIEALELARDLLDR